jgi:hypothetical protein
MFPVTHLLASWIIAVKTTDNARDCRLVALAGIAPDLDGLGLITDLIRNGINHTDSFPCYQYWHHYLLHGIAGAALISVVAAMLARHRWRVLVLSMAVVHLHLLCDLAGSRGPDPVDLWPIFYLGPFRKDPMWIWNGQWRLDGWQNQLISVGLLAWSLRIAVARGTSFAGLISSRLDELFVTTLRTWKAALLKRP